VTAPTIGAGSNTAVIGFYGIATGTTYSANSALTPRFTARNPDVAGPSTQGATGTSSGSDYATAALGGQFVAQHISLDAPPNVAPFPGTTPPYSDARLAADMARWIPVGLTGTSNADINQRYKNADGSINTASTLDRTIGCVLSPNALTQGTDQASPFLFATAYLVGTPLTPAHGRPGVTTGIIFETDGTPQTTNFTCQQAQTAATAAKAAGIEVFTIGFFASNSPGTRCPDTTGTWSTRTIVQSLAAMATSSATVSTTACDANENTDNDHFFCTPDPAELANVFRAAAVALAKGTRLVQLYPQPTVTGVGPGGGSITGGTTVNITGTYFTEAYAVTFGGTPATSFHVLSDTSITAVAPAHGAGTVDIQVSTPGGSSSITSADRDTYTSP
jgi:hypothetical protein